jgi:regulator of sigma E protease
MQDILGSIWWLLVTLGILVTFHEFGHFWVARRCGVKVLRFSIGFGKPIWSRTSKDGVEFAIGAVPLGGYVKFLDAREADNPELVAHQAGEYNAAPVWQRMAIAIAGPLFNVAFTVFAFWAMFVVGRPDFQPIIGTPSGLAAQAGLHSGDRIVAVAGDPVDSWSAVMLAVGENALQRRDTLLDVADKQGTTQQHTLQLSQLPRSGADDEKTFLAIGLHRQTLPLAAPQKGMPAADAGMIAGDRIVRVNETTIDDFEEIAPAIAAQAAKNPALDITVDRNGTPISLKVKAEFSSLQGETKWRIGVGMLSAPMNATERYGALKAVPAAFGETWKQTRSTLSLIAGMLSGQVSPKNLSSVIGIAEVANASAHLGLAWFLSFLAVISLSLGILNLLPIPILDGGHLLYYLIEWVKGSPLSERTMIAGQYVGMAVLLTLMSLAFYNDILRHIAG